MKTLNCLILFSILSFTLLMPNIQHHHFEVKADVSYNNHKLFLDTSITIKDNKICFFGGVEANSMYMMIFENDSEETGRCISFSRIVNLLSDNESVQLGLNLPEHLPESKGHLILKLKEVKLIDMVYSLLKKEIK